MDRMLSKPTKANDVRHTNDTYHSIEELPLVLRVEDLMPILGIGRNTAYDLVRCGQIRSVHAGKQLRITKQALLDYLELNT